MDDDKSSGRNLQILFERKGFGTNHVTIGKDAHIVVAGAEELFHIPEGIHSELFSCIFYGTIHRVRNLAVFIAEGRSFGEHLVGGFLDADIEGAHAIGSCDILGDREGNLYAAAVFDSLGHFTTLFLFHRQRDVRGIELGANGDLLRDRCLLVVQPCSLLGRPSLLTLDAGVLLGETFVEPVERVNLKYITAQYSSHRGELFLQTGYFAGISRFHALQFFEQLLSLELFLGQLLEDGVVVDLSPHLAILLGKLLIFVFHLLLVESCQLLHLAVFLLLLGKIDKEVGHTTQKQDDDYNEGNYNLLVHIRIVICFCYINIVSAKLGLFADMTK